MLSLLQNFPLLYGQMLSRPIDIEIKHRHRRCKRSDLTPLAIVGGIFQRQRNSTRIIPSEHAGLEIQRVTGFGDLL